MSELDGILKEREKFKKEMDKYKSIKNHYRNFIVLSLLLGVVAFLNYMLWYVSVPFLVIAIVSYFIKRKYNWKFTKYEFVYLCTFATEEILKENIDLNDKEQCEKYFDGLKDRSKKVTNKTFLF